MAKYFSYSLLFIFSIILIVKDCRGQSVIIKGIVKDKESVLPMATVSLGKRTVLTDQMGEFRFWISPGTYMLIITHAGYKKIEQKLKVDSGRDQSFEFILTPVELMDEVMMIGSRTLIHRSSLNTAVPVDVFSSHHLIQTGQTSLTQMLQFAAPSFNSSRQLINEPITLRGLDPDQVLILINGYRYHNMAYLNHGGVRGILGRGSVANDLNSIPFSAIDKIEILRDGAAAQYGSDAIAGVINIILKKTSANTSVNIHSGQFYKADGENFKLGVNHGIPFRKKGVLNFSIDFLYRHPTYRGGAYKGTVYVSNLQRDDSIIKARNFDRTKVSNAGSSKLINYGFLVSGGYPVKEQTELFWTVMLNDRKTVFISPYTLPKFSNRVNTDLFPDGFQSRPNHSSRDLSATAGVKGNTENRWRWEYGSTYGNNTDRYYVDNSNNASQFFTLGKNAPTSFYTGELKYQQFTNDIHMSKNLSATIDRLLHLGFGAEWRHEYFQIIEGEEAAWANYDSLGRKQGGANGGLVFQPGDAIKENRSVWATYIDFESEPDKNFLFDMAVRYEYYSDFGGNIAGKLAARYKFSEKFSLRGSINNGFRAPALQQRHYSFTNRTLTSTGGTLVPVILGIFPNNSEVANAFGIPSLNAERSVNLNAGFTARVLDRLSLTIDGYWIQVRNRIVLSGSFDTTNADVKEILRNTPGVDRVQFFVNAINTRTYGMDVVLNGNWKMKKATLMMMLSANFTRTRLFGKIKAAGKLRADSLNTNTLFNRFERTRIEKGQPADKIILSLQYKTGKFDFLLHNTRFGKTELVSVSDPNNTSLDEFFSPRILTDFSISYIPKAWLTLTVGGNNILNIYPDKIKDYRNTAEGIFIYGQEATPFGFNGGYYYVSMSFNF